MKLIKSIYRLVVNIKQKTYRIFCTIIVSLAALFCMNASSLADTIYVDGSLTPCGDGEGWSTAYRYLQDALAAADGFTNDQIWVKGSETYYPDENCANPGGTGDWNATFNMIDGVAILGGFDGTETVATDRDPVANETILSGDIGGVGLAGCGTGDCFTAHPSPGCQNANICDFVCEYLAYCCTIPWDSGCADFAAFWFPTYNNTLHIVTANDVIATSILDGFTITKGKCIEGVNALSGAGLNIFDASPTIVRCKFIDNHGSNGGGASVAAAAAPAPSSEPLFVNCQGKKRG